jgi:membrane fusion protein, copper/silver efflux system
MRRTNTLLIVTLGAGIALGLALGWSQKSPAPAAAATSAAPAESPRRILYYRNPMNPQVTADKPTKDSMGMEYIPVYADAQSNDAGIRIDSRQVQNLGVRTGVVEKRAFARSIHTVGTVLIDEHGVSAFSPKVSGWLERLHVKAVGDVVERGQSLAEIYSPELLSAQDEYRIASQAGRQIMGAGDTAMHDEMQALAQAARERLRLLDLPAADIAALTRGRPAQRTVSLRAPYRGIVTALDVREGASITPEMRLFTLADLSRVWVNVEVYANQLPWVKVGDPVQLDLAFIPGRHWQGRIDYLYPTLNPQSRTVTARLAFDNADGVLRPGMYANATIGTTASGAVLAVPREAVLHSGTQDSVILALGAGHFQPVTVHTGAENDDYVEIVDGLQEGQKIVLSGQFLLDAEANFQGAGARMQGGDAAVEKSPLSPRGEGQGEGAHSVAHDR